MHFLENQPIICFYNLCFFSPSLFSHFYSPQSLSFPILPPSYLIGFPITPVASQSVPL